MKESSPVKVAEYVVISHISQEPDFAWWATFVIKKRNRIIENTNSKYWTRTNKFGIKVTREAAEAKRFDDENSNTLWWDSICKEMKDVQIAFKNWEKGIKNILPGYQKVKCHMIFDIKMGENFRQKDRIVAGGYTTTAPDGLNYSSVMSHDSRRIALTIVALNDIEVMACNIKNAYLTAKFREKIWTISGPEFGSDIGQPMIVV